MNSGYLNINLTNEFGNVKGRYIHRLVADTFIPNPNDFKEVNHKDEDKSNNYVGNLEWCNRKYNCNHGTRNQKISKSNIIKKRSEESKIRMSKAKSIKVICKNTMEVFESCSSVYEKYKIDASSISKCCRGKQKTAGRHPDTNEPLIWEYFKE